MAGLKRGDLVRCFRSVCKCVTSQRHIGIIFVLDECETLHSAKCSDCGTHIGKGLVVWLHTRRQGNLKITSAFCSSTLKRIPPLSELESENNKEELTA